MFRRKLTPYDNNTKRKKRNSKKKKKNICIPKSPRCVFALLNLHMTSPLADLELVKSHHPKALKSANNNSWSTLYLSGNPGSVESQLARLTAKRLLDEGKEIPSSIPFLRTLHAKNSETLLESLASFARHCRLPNYIVTDTHNSKDLSTDEKIASLTTLSNKRKNWASHVVVAVRW